MSFFETRCTLDYYTNKYWCSDAIQTYSKNLRPFFNRCWSNHWQLPDYTHTHTFNGPFSGTAQVSRYQKGKTNLDFTEARDSEWQWHQLAQSLGTPRLSGIQWTVQAVLIAELKHICLHDISTCGVLGDLNDNASHKSLHKSTDFIWSMSDFKMCSTFGKLWVKLGLQAGAPMHSVVWTGISVYNKYDSHLLPGGTVLAAHSLSASRQHWWCRHLSAAVALTLSMSR